MNTSLDEQRAHQQIAEGAPERDGRAGGPLLVRRPDTRGPGRSHRIAASSVSSTAGSASSASDPRRPRMAPFIATTNGISEKITADCPKSRQIVSQTPAVGQHLPCCGIERASASRNSCARVGHRGRTGARVEPRALGHPRSHPNATVALPVQPREPARCGRRAGPAPSCPPAERCNGASFSPSARSAVSGWYAVSG